jgi:hypothetical protein
MTNYETETVECTICGAETEFNVTTWFEYGFNSQWDVKGKPGCEHYDGTDRHGVIWTKGEIE